MSYYETVEDIESEGEEIEEESVEEEIVPKRRKQKKWKVRRIYREGSWCRQSGFDDHTIKYFY